jgi:hypothetical protein
VWGEVAATNSRGVEAVTKFLRFRFSLTTLLLAVAWSAVAVWINVTPRVTVAEASIVRPRTVISFHLAHWGWPWDYADDLAEFLPDRVPRCPASGLTSYWALAGDAAVGVLLVVVLTWCSNQLLRRVGAKLRRRTAGESKS